MKCRWSLCYLFFSRELKRVVLLMCVSSRLDADMNIEFQSDSDRTNTDPGEYSDEDMYASCSR